MQKATPHGAVLYITYDGVMEPLGQSQVLAYLEKLASNRPIHLISFEKASDRLKTSEWEILRQRIAASGIQWHPLTYHKRPTALATAWDIGVGIITGLWLVLRYRFRIVHARSYVPSVIALVIKRLTGVQYVFDMRGFWADERVDGGLWPRIGHMYRVAKWFERRFLLGADHVVSLTNAAVRIMKGFDYLQGRMPPFTVISTCADLTRFKPADNPVSNSSFVLGYVGTAGTWYLFDEVATSVAALLRLKPDAQFLVVNRGEHDYIRQRLQAAGVPESAIEVTSAAHAEVPALMARMDAGIFFIKPAYSKQASAPTKLAEFLGCGIPCLGNVGVGDMAEILRDNRVGAAIERFDTESLREGLVRLLALVEDPETKQRCVKTASKHFSLDEGVERYELLYRCLLHRSGAE